MKLQMDKKKLTLKSLFKKKSKHQSDLAQQTFLSPACIEAHGFREPADLKNAYKKYKRTLKDNEALAVQVLNLKKLIEEEKEYRNKVVNEVQEIDQTSDTAQ